MEVMTGQNFVFSVVINSSSNLTNMKSVINSLTNQFYSSEDFEVIICDSITYEGLAPLCKNTKYINIEYYKKPTNISFSDNLQQIMKIANSENIIFLNDTGELSPKFLVEHENALKKTYSNRILIQGNIKFNSNRQSEPLAQYFNKKNTNFAYPNMLPYSFYDYRYFRMDNICIPKYAILDALDLATTSRNKEIENYCDLAYLFQKMGYSIYFYPDAVVYSNKHITLSDFTKEQYELGLTKIQLFNKYQELVKREKSLIGFSKLDETALSKINKYLENTKDIERLLRIIERLTKLDIENPDFIPLSNGRFINYEELNEMLHKYLNIIHLHFFYKGLLAGIEKYGKPKLSEWHINNETSKTENGKPRILITAYGWKNSGGGTIIPYDIAYALSEKGWQVAVLYVGANAADTEINYHLREHEENGLRLYGLFNRKTPMTLENYPEYEIEDKAAVAKFEDVINDFKPQVIHYHNILGLSFEIAKVAHERNIPSFYTPHNYYLIDPKLYMMRTFTEKWGNLDLLSNTPLTEIHPEKIELYKERKNTAIKFANEYVNHTFAISDRVRDILINFGVEETKISTLHQIGKASNSIIARLKNSDKITFGYIGSIVPHKGVHKILQATEYLPKGSTTISFFGDAYLRYQRHLEKIDVKSMIQWHPPFKQEEINNIFASFDVLIIPSIWEEGAGLVAIEAIKAGIPVIAADIGGLPDFIKHGKNGFLYPPNDEKRLAELMLNLISKPYLVTALRENCKLEYEFSDMIEHLENLYIQAAKGNLQTDKIEKRIISG